ncbi:sulfite exporter TauE/SafE family protein [Pseudooceanicola sediminis]|nr:sulfite exporter TauE/SafE family protein [Pseudooceanicola sediminis]|tara:strand:- start:16539 stop:17285 length:747 start_codon:yes stop_codon:yes gene_type:complete
MPEHLILLAIAAFVVGLAKGGLTAAGALSVPLLSLFMDPLQAAGVILPVYIASDVVAVILYRRDFSLRNLKVLVPAGLVGIVIAMFIAPMVPVAGVSLATGLIGLIYCLQVAWARLKGRQEARPFSARRGWVFGILCGVTSFISHNGAPPFQAFVLPQRLENLTFAGTATILFAIINVSKIPAYTELGLWDQIELPRLAWMIVVSICGAFSGRFIVGRLPKWVYMGLVQIMLFCVSVFLIYEALGVLL